LTVGYQVIGSKMVLPLALGLVGAGAGSAVLGSTLGGGSGKKISNQNSYSTQVSKKESITDQSQFTFSPQTTSNKSFNPQINLGSDSTLAKKDRTSATPSQEVSPTASVATKQTSRKSAEQTQSATQSGGMKKLLVAGLVAGGGYLALQYIDIGGESE